MDRIGVKSHETGGEKGTIANLTELLQRCPIPEDQLLSNLGLFLLSKNLARILFMDHIYKQIVSLHGVIIDFGTRWGQNMILFSALRGIYEPFNRHRKIIGFDTFEGFPDVTEEDGQSDLMKKGNVSCVEDYEKYLWDVAICHEQHNPCSHIRKFDIIKGDVATTFPQYLSDHPETLVSLAYFDFDIFAPTKRCLDEIWDRLPKGAILAFDELCCPDSPGETTALLQSPIDIGKVRINRLPFVSRVCYIVKE